MYANANANVCMLRCHHQDYGKCLQRSGLSMSLTSSIYTVVLPIYIDMCNSAPPDRRRRSPFGKCQQQSCIINACNYNIVFIDTSKSR